MRKKIDHVFSVAMNVASSLIVILLAAFGSYAVYLAYTSSIPYIEKSVVSVALLTLVASLMVLSVWLLAFFCLLLPVSGCPILPEQIDPEQCEQTQSLKTNLLGAMIGLILFALFLLPTAFAVKHYWHNEGQLQTEQMKPQ